MKETKISKYLIYVLVFLFPIFFFPFFQNVLDFPKEILLSFFVSLASFFLLAEVFKTGKIKIPLHFFHFIIISFFLFVILSFLFSKSKIQSFLGLPFEISSSFLTFFLLTIFYFLSISIFTKEEIFNLPIIFSFSLFLVIVFSFFQIFEKYLLPFDFARSRAFTLLGTPYSLSTILACLLPFFILSFALSERFLKFFFFLLTLVSLIYLVLVSHFVSWFLAIVSLTILLSVLIIRKEFFNYKVLILSLISLSISLSFLIFNFRPLLLPAEIFLGQKASFEIALKSLKERPLFGSGPSTFLFQFSKFKPSFLNETPFWNTRFLNPSSNFLLFLSNLGILGNLFFLLILILPPILSLSKKETVVFAPSLFSFALFQFIYPFNLTQTFVFFLMLVPTIKLICEKEKEIEFTKEKGTSFFVSFFFIFLFIFLMGTLIFIFQTGLSEYFYFQGIRAWQGVKMNLAIQNLERAKTINPWIPQYLRDLSQFYLLVLQDKLQKNETDIGGELFTALDLAKRATEKEKENVLNWSVRAFIYQSLLGIATGAEDWATRCWQEAEGLEPQNPYFYTQEGMVFLRKAMLGQESQENFQRAQDLFQKAINLKSDYAPAHFQMAILYQAKGELDKAILKLEETKNLVPDDVGLIFQLGLSYYQKGNYQKAKEELERAVALSPDYANALYFLGLTYDKLGDKGRAIEKLKRVAELNPDVELVKKIIKNLEEGKEALEGISQTIPPQTPIEQKPEEIKK